MGVRVDADFYGFVYDKRRKQAEQVMKSNGVLCRIRQIFSVTIYNFRQWHRNSRVVVTFLLAFILCFLLTDKAVHFAHAHGTTIQIMEPFIWTFGDSNSILLSSLLLLLLFADMPFLSPGTPFFLVRINRTVWMLGQILYVTVATLMYLLFIFAATAFVCMTKKIIRRLL